jgi:predicted HNH restriction endonuclease
MKKSGPVTLAQVESAINNLGGQGTWDKILAEVTQLRGGDFSHYLNKENYEKTAFQLIQEHCPKYKKYRGTTRFEKVGNTFRLIGTSGKILRRPRVEPEKHTPRAIDIEELTQPERVLQETYRILRDTTLARKVKESHKYRCQICGETLKLADGTPYAEAHHVMPLGKPHNGPDVRSNILCVCPNDHVLLDYGSIKLDGDRLDGIGRDYINYHNHNIYGNVLV